MPSPESTKKNPKSIWKRISTIATLGILGLTASLSALPPHISTSIHNAKPLKEFPRKAHRL